MNNMNFSIEVKVMPLKELLDPQGKAVMNGLGNLGLSSIDDVRIGKNITMQVNATSAEEARNIAEEAAKKLLANPVMEYYEVTMKENAS
jgi:phosphoribosylformylglycinamidine synthase subunit PurS